MSNKQACYSFTSHYYLENSPGRRRVHHLQVQALHLHRGQRSRAAPLARKVRAETVASPPLYSSKTFFASAVTEPTSAPGCRYDKTNRGELVRLTEKVGSRYERGTRNKRTAADRARLVTHTHAARENSNQGCLHHYDTTGRDAQEGRKEALPIGQY